MGVHGLRILDETNRFSVKNFFESNKYFVYRSEKLLKNRCAPVAE